MTLRIAMWSGPRNLSTAMMRSFGSRADTMVSDEPFYGAFLKTSGAAHPMAAEVIAASKGEARRKLAENAVRIDDAPVQDGHEIALPSGAQVKVSLGKKRHAVLRRA